MDINVDDSNNYIDMCSKILSDNEIFKNFKSSEHYNVILEHVDENLGRQYYEHIQKVGNNIFEDMFENFAENDSIGNPKQFLYGDKKISPTTLRYIKNVLDLSILCDGIQINKVVEVGCGYGGLCKTMSVLCDFDEYICVDLPEVVALQEKYLSQFSNLKDKVKFVPCNKLKNISNVDLFISNYALSELTIEAQLNYYDKIIKNSKVVYITYNSITNSKDNYNTIISKLEADNFTFEKNYSDYGYHNNAIISAKR